MGSNSKKIFIPSSLVFISLILFSPNSFTQAVCQYDGDGVIIACNIAGNDTNFSEGQRDGFRMCMHNSNSSEYCTGLVLNDNGGAEGESGSLGGDIPTRGKKEKPSKTDSPVETDACSTQVKTTKKQCTGAEWAQLSSVALQLANVVAQQKSAGNIKAACESAQKINTLGGVANGAVSAMCARAVSSCKAVCGKEDPECTQFDAYAKLAGMQAIENATALVGSTACANAVAGKCTGDAAYNDEECTQFCMKPGRQDHPKCKIALNNCSNPSYAAQNVQMCTCINNPLSPTCTIATNNPTTNHSSLNLDDSGGSEFDFYGATGEGNPAKVNTPDSGGGNGLGGGGGSFAFGNDGKTNGTENSNDKDILRGTGGTPGSTGIFFGKGYPDTQSGGSKNTSNTGDTDTIDLRAFLPGGKKDPKRIPASAYSDPSITKANGLTNWQKITRKMNEKKPELMP